MGWHYLVNNILILQVDIISGTFSLDQTMCFTVLWITKFWFMKEQSVCSFPLQSIRKVVFKEGKSSRRLGPLSTIDYCRMLKWWGNLSVAVPYPVEDVLRKMYGNNYRAPDDNWIWDRSPFNTGYCRHDITLKLTNYSQWLL